MIYSSQRKILLDSVFELDAGIENLSNSKLVELLLYGNPLLYSKNVNASILKLTISYLMNTERFDCPLFEINNNSSTIFNFYNYYLIFFLFHLFSFCVQCLLVGTFQQQTCSVLCRFIYFLFSITSFIACKFV